MNGPHDLGGAHGFGAVAAEPDEPRFHADWERRAFALTLAAGAIGAWTIDMSRHARERIAPADYLASSYYEIWLKGLERLLVETGLATAEEIASGRPERPGMALPHRITSAEVPAALAKGTSYERPATRAARFRPGDEVTARIINPVGHTRLPRYVRGRRGTVAQVRGPHVFPDASAAGLGDEPQWLYSVAFSATEVWGDEAARGDEIILDLFEPYLDHA